MMMMLRCERAETNEENVLEKRACSQTKRKKYSSDERTAKEFFKKNIYY